MPQRLHAAALAKGMSKQEPNLDTVVIITGRVSHSRCCKLAYGLKLCNYKVVLLHLDRNFSHFDEKIKSLFAEILIYNSPEDALRKAMPYRPIAYHILCNWDYDLAKYFIQVNPGVVVVDPFDILGGFIRPQVVKRYFLQEKAERFCFENADGICCRDLRTQYLKQKLGYCLSPRLFWPDYCWPVGFTKSRRKTRGGKSVAYVGNIEIDPSSPVAYQYDLARLLAQSGINFHIYPALSSQTLELGNEMRKLLSPDLLKYVHIHDPLSFLDLSGELSAFPAGILISTKNVNYGNDHDTYFEFMSDYFLSAKIFDYHEAGLLCLTQKMRLANHLFAKNGAVREVQSLAEIVETISNLEIREIDVDPKLRLDYHARRLPEFYLRLYNQRLKQAGLPSGVKLYL